MDNVYVKKPVSVHAEQVLTSDCEASPFINEAFRIGVLHFTDRGFIVDTLEGSMFADYGSYLICGVHQEYYPCKQAIFDETYEKKENS